MTLNEYQELAARTIPADLIPADKEQHAIHGMAGEVGEIHSLYQKQFQGHEFDLEHAQKELGDLMWFIAEWCTSWGITLESVCAANIEKLKNRYPEGFSIEKSLHRKEGDI